MKKAAVIVFLVLLGCFCSVYFVNTKDQTKGYPLFSFFEQIEPGMDISEAKSIVKGVTSGPHYYKKSVSWRWSANERIPKGQHSHTPTQVILSLNFDHEMTENSNGIIKDIDFRYYSGPDQTEIVYVKPNRTILGVGYDLVSETVSATIIPAGARIDEVFSGTSAEKAGIKAGDIILEVDDSDVSKDKSILRNYILSKSLGDIIKLRFWRAGKIFTKEVKLSGLNGMTFQH